VYNGWNFLAEMWRDVSPLAECTLILLTFMFFWMLFRGIEHFARYRAAVWESRRFLKDARGLLQRGDWNGVLVLAEMWKRSHVAIVLASALQEFLRARTYLPVTESIEAGNRGARVAKNRIHERLRQGMRTLGTIATTAPLIGFCGTIIGICDSFHSFIGSKAAHLAHVANNIAEALVCTAAGILVAIPTVWCFNLMRDRLLTLDMEMEITSRDLVKYLERQTRVGVL